MGQTTHNTSNSNQAVNAQSAVRLCAVTLATNPVEQIGTYVPGWKIVWNGAQTIDANYAFIAVDSSGKNYALVIRGSVPFNSIFNDWDIFANWVLEDLNAVTQVSWPYASTPQPRISLGAYIAFTNMLDMKDSLGSGLSIAEYLLANTIGNDKQLMITGHSLGGNMANVYASYYIQTLTQQGQSANNISLCTFAAPAAGNTDFATDLDAKLPAAWHYQNANDVIPHLPVFKEIIAVSRLYVPQPAAAEIMLTYKGQTMNLQDAFHLIAGVFLLYDYQQPKNNYTTFPTNLYPQYEDNTVKDWLGQMGAQHQLQNYAQYLGVTLPSMISQPLAQLV